MFSINAVVKIDDYVIFQSFISKAVSIAFATLRKPPIISHACFARILPTVAL